MNTMEAMSRGLRIPPQAVEAEQSVLGGLMLSPDRIDAISLRLEADDFYRRDHRLIYRAMVELSGRGTPCDAITLGEWFAKNKFDQVDPSYLMELLEKSFGTAGSRLPMLMVYWTSMVCRRLHGGNGMKLARPLSASALGDSPMVSRYRFSCS